MSPQALSSMSPRFLAASLLMASLAACTSVGPDYEAPQVDVPAAWREEAPPPAPPAPEQGPWWERFGDPLLASLVERSLQGGLDLRSALARVDEARALRGIARGEPWPVVDLAAGYARRGESDNTPSGSFVPDSDLYTVGLEAGWELDLWGRVRRSVEAADADLAATMEAASDVALSVAAETAFTYIELRAFQARLGTARTNVALQEETLAIVRGRLDAGLAGERDVAQALSILEATRSRVPALETGLRFAENRLAVLVGLPPGSLARELELDQPIPVPPLSIAVDVPAQLLRRRPDVRQAERQLAAETARIGVASGDLYPRIALSGTLGLASDSLDDLADGDSSFFGIGPSLRWNLFDRRTLHARVEARDARAEQARISWQQTVLAALEETENALTRFAREQARRASLDLATEQARAAIELARIQYVEGLSDFQAVLDSQRSLAVLEDDLAESEAAIAASAVAVFRALGGGWEGGPVEGS